MRKLTVLGAVAVVAVLVATVALGHGQPASAAITGNSVAGTVWTVTSDGASDSIRITCSGGNVKANGADPTTGPKLCSVITGIVVNGAGGQDTINLSSVTVAAFSGLLGVILNGNDGNDTITGSAVDDVINGGWR